MLFFQTYQYASDQANKLAYVNPAGNAVLRVDNTTNGAGNGNFGRNSINMTTNSFISKGSLILIDMVHAPTGCSLWPAVYLSGAEEVWPNGGEIDIFENVNLATQNRYSLHTLPGCTHPGNTTSGAQTESGSLLSTDCGVSSRGNQGCVVVESKSNSFGRGFNSQGGGSFATLWNDDGISTFYFPRGSEPSDFSSSNPNPSSWGTPSSFYPDSSCSGDKFFKPLTLIVDINICGNFAGNPAVFAQTCAASGTTECQTLVRDPTNFNEAWFEFGFIKVFTEGGSSAQPSGTTPATGKTPTSTTGASGSPSSSPNGASSLKSYSTAIFGLSAIVGALMI